MKDVNVSLLFHYFIFLLGIALILFSIFKKTKTASLVQTGVKAEATVRRIEYSPQNRENNNIVMDKVTVDFTTKKNEWISAEISQEFALFYTGQYRLGDKVELYYDPAAPSSFYVTTGQSESNGRLFSAAAGIIFSLIGMYLLFRR